MSAAAGLAEAVSAVRRTPGGGALEATAVDLSEVYKFIETRSTSQNGGEGVSVADFSPELLSGFKYFGNRLCPFANRAYWTLEAKGLLSTEKAVGPEYIHINLGSSKPAWYKDNIYYKGTLPSLVYDGKVIGESAIVAEFLDERFPTKTPLMPTAPEDRAAVRFLVKIFDGGLSALYQVLMNKDAAQDEAKIDAAITFLKEINDIYARQSPAGPYFLGDVLSLADIAVVPFLARFEVTLPFYRGVSLLERGGEGVARLRLLLDAAKTVDSFKRTFPTPEFLVASYFDYAGGKFSS